MHTKEHYLSLIPDYLKGHLSPEESAQIERLKAEDPEFLQAFQFQQALYEGHQLWGDGGLSEQVRQQLVQASRPGQQAAGRLIRLWVLGGVAAVILLLMMAAMLWLREQHLHYEASAHALLPDHISERYTRGANPHTFGKSEALLDTLLKGMQNYTAGNYQAATAALQYYDAQYPADPAVKLYLGICLLQQKKYKQAIPPLEYAASRPSFSLQQEAQIRLAEACFQAGRYFKAARLYQHLARIKP